MKRFFKIASAVLLLACPFIALKAQTQSTEESWIQAKKQAQTEKKLIFVDLYFTGCMPCAQMDKEVFPDPKVTAVLNADFVTFKSDILKEEIGKKLCMKYGVTGFPTFLLMNADGKVIDIAGGFHNVEQFLALLQNAKEAAKKGNFKKYSPEIQEKDYPDFYKQAYLDGKRNVPFEVIDAYLKSKDVADEISFVIITGLRVGKQYDDAFLLNSKKLAKDYGRWNVTTHVFSILQRKKKEYEKKKDLKGFTELVNDSKELYTPEEFDKYSSILLKDFGVEKVVVNPSTSQK
ncbi:thioredoxin-related protein [Flavobacterium nitrogenifigens]|uniref:Thioredoxin-related protein n=2 Tax=Flavobacterium TaxID=237 RepID=A0A7W7IWC8_9FLAO|nr:MULTISPECIES: thioredoxin fold domain-containing protein [Flavobacterium]MBB4801568.1 thioredoxin-related protein [Flavobacterium nitrogenifigens]MBB6386525.1 thioredoxin-related protein [Flavobacterium notoginsengisoli]